MLMMSWIQEQRLQGPAGAALELPVTQLELWWEEDTVLHHG